MSISSAEHHFMDQRGYPGELRAARAATPVYSFRSTHEETIGHLTLRLLEGRCEEVIHTADRLIGSLDALGHAAEIRDLHILRALAELDRASGPAGNRAPATETALRFARRILPTLNRLVAPGLELLPPDSTERPLAAVPASPPPPKLTGREQETLALTELGLSNKEIAQRLWIEEATVKKHQSNVLRKLGARNRTQAVTKARQLGLLSHPRFPRADDGSGDSARTGA